MKTFLFRLSLAAAVLSLTTVALGARANAQTPSSQDPAATASPRQSPASSPDGSSTNDPAATSQQNEPQMPAAGRDAQTEEARAFTGKIVKQNGRVILLDPVTKITYQIDDAAKVKAYMGKDVKVTGKLDLNSNMIHVTGIESLSTD